MVRWEKGSTVLARPHSQGEEYYSELFGWVGLTEKPKEGREINQGKKMGSEQKLSVLKNGFQKP